MPMDRLQLAEANKKRGVSPAGCVLLSFLVLMFAAAPLGFAQATGKTVRRHSVAEPENSLAQAEAAIEKKDYASAEPLLQKVVSGDPKNYQAWFDLGFVHNAQGRPEDSIAAYRKSVEAKPDIFESNLNLGLMLAKTGQPDAAEFLRAATKLKPTSHADEGRARAWLSLGHVLETSDPPQAIEAYRQAAFLLPKEPEPRLAAGPLLEKENRFADAEQQYKEALALAPDSSDALIGLANLYMRGRRFGDAEEVLKKLVSLHPDDPAVHMQLGRMYAADGRNEDAIAELQVAAKLAPNDAGVQRDMADLLSMTGKFGEAAAQYKILLAANPRDPLLHHGLGVALLRQRKFPEAQQELLAAVQLKPDFGAAYGDLAVAANENKDYPLAIKATDARAKFLPEIPMSYFLRATAYDHLRDMKQAAQYYHRFLEVANGQYPDQEWQARHRLIAIEPKK
ncbi:MAG: tetratricopeptide repeat protein [Acidobacteria bacterium]|nr:tetratricopeptide repeat protein [Acidobacteriota bacterium]